MTPAEKRQRLGNILQGDVCTPPATVWDALSARVAEAHGADELTSVAEAVGS